MNKKDLERAAKLYQTWTNTQLIRAMTVEREQYLPEAIEVMESEVSRRGLSSSVRKNEESRLVQKAQEVEEKKQRKVEEKKKASTRYSGAISRIGIVLAILYIFDRHPGLGENVLLFAAVFGSSMIAYYIGSLVDRRSNTTGDPVVYRTPFHCGKCGTEGDPLGQSLMLQVLSGNVTPNGRSTIMQCRSCGFHFCEMCANSPMQCPSCHKTVF